MSVSTAPVFTGDIREGISPTIRRKAGSNNERKGWMDEWEECS